ncbi:hypothetical protein OSL33_23370, partial [Escherichia coli]|nr:hypothetical protein [Escherichia coli]
SLSHLFCVVVRISPFIRWPNLVCHYTVTKQDNEYSPYEPFVNMIKAFYRMELTKVPQGKLTGKDNIF